MMSGMALVWLIVVFVIVMRARGPRLASRTWSNALPPERQQTPDELARERYAKGEIGWPEYQEVLVNLLKDRYVRGELELAEYEERASRVLDGRRQDLSEAVSQLQAARPAEEPQPRGLEDGAQHEQVTDELPPSVDNAPKADVPGPSTTTNTDGGTGERQSKVRTDPALEDLRRRFLTGELTYQEYEEQRKHLMAA